jgi:hypothetical protein
MLNARRICGPMTMVIGCLVAVSAACGANGKTSDGGSDRSDDAVDRDVTLDVSSAPCTTAPAGAIYAVGLAPTTFDQVLLRFDPGTGSFASVGTITCLPSGTSGASPLIVPYSLAGDRNGTLFIVVSDQRILRVDARTVACSWTAFDPSVLNQWSGFTGLKALAVANDGVSNGEVLYGYDYTDSVALNPLIRIDPMTFATSEIGFPRFGGIGVNQVLSGSSSGDLFALDGNLLHLMDRATAQTTASWSIQSVPVNYVNSTMLGLASWGCDFYLFISGQSSIVARVSPPDRAFTTVAPLAQSIYAVGLSTGTPN